jgi:hypothetical protein
MLAVALVWVRSSTQYDGFVYRIHLSANHQWAFLVTTRPGQFIFFVDNVRLDAPIPPGKGPTSNWESHSWPRDYATSDPGPFSRFAFAASRQSNKANAQFWGTTGSTQVALLHVPDWFLILVFAVLPFTSLLVQRGKRRQAGCCRSCGYNLTGNVSGICPECGTAVAVKPQRQ